MPKHISYNFMTYMQRQYLQNCRADIFHKYNFVESEQSNLDLIEGVCLSSSLFNETSVFNNDIKTLISCGFKNADAQKEVTRYIYKMREFMCENQNIKIPQSMLLLFNGDNMGVPITCVALYPHQVDSVLRCINEVNAPKWKQLYSSCSTSTEKAHVKKMQMYAFGGGRSVEYKIVQPHTGELHISPGTGKVTSLGIHTHNGKVPKGFSSTELSSIDFVGNLRSQHMVYHSITDSICDKNEIRKLISPAPQDGLGIHSTFATNWNTSSILGGQDQAVEVLDVISSSSDSKNDIFTVIAKTLDGKDE